MCVIIMYKLQFKQYIFICVGLGGGGGRCKACLAQAKMVAVDGTMDTYIDMHTCMGKSKSKACLAPTRSHGGIHDRYHDGDHEYVHDRHHDLRQLPIGNYQKQYQGIPCTYRKPKSEIHTL